MVTVKAYHHREGDSGKYISLELMGELELVQSSNTGRFYATVRRCFISSTFDESVAQLMIGKKINGTIHRVECEPYDYVVPETGEVIRIGFRWDYDPEEALTVSKAELSIV